MITGRASRANGPSMGNQSYRQIVKFVERFKKFSSSIIVVLMGTACVLTLIVYIYRIILAKDSKYFIARTRQRDSII